MRGTAFSLSILGTLALVACGDGGSSPGTDTGEGTAAAFDQIADSIAGGGDFAHADALRHAAVIVRFTGDPTPVTLTIGGEDRAFVAVAEELEYPNFVCSAGADSGVAYPDSGGVPRDSMSVPPAPPTPVICQPQGSTRMRTLIAWEPQHMNEVVRLVADEGRGDVMPGVPDPMAGPSHVGEAWGGTGAEIPQEFCFRNLRHASVWKTGGWIRWGLTAPCPCPCPCPCPERDTDTTPLLTIASSEGNSGSKNWMPDV